MEIFTLITGVAYIVLEIRQKNAMWVVGVLTALAAMYMFWQQNLFASFALNVYYLVMSFWGLWQWRQDSRRLTSGDNAKGDKDGDTIHLSRITWKAILGCSIAFILGFILLKAVLIWLGDPMSDLDAGVAVLSAVATYMLARSYIQQWWLWIVADALSTVLCAAQGMYWMTLLYALYTASAVYGYYHWKRHGTYID